MRSWFPDVVRITREPFEMTLPPGHMSPATPPPGRFVQCAAGLGQPGPDHGQRALSLIERIERALVLLAYFIELDGDVHLPMYAKFEAELEELKRAEALRERARRRLAAYSEAGTGKPIN